ncbi:late blight resistance homolog R1A-10 [Olea europaea subsp. europaea]|uniref:Late blight resistance homolog R1A-10 n=1 Tax=Olea europaea subsp. europaea TaxID=158383 RepID=A0A8S0TGS6_OLEEU|nr:late blight resistance homolog R1A-10 [Olea europaea subsp. europaea]
MHVLEQNIQQKYTFLNRLVKKRIASLLEKVISLLDFLENCSRNSCEAIECLENQIRDAAHLAEDIVESSVVNRLLPESTSNRDKILIFFCSDSEKVYKEIDSLMNQVMKIEDNVVLEDQQPRTWMPSKTGLGGNRLIVSLDNDLMEIKTRLVSESSHLETVSIVGMGGMVSQEYNVREIILSLFDSMPKSTDKMHKKSTHRRHEENTEGLKELLYKSLKGKKYLIVMDDVWDDEILDELRRSFPNDENRSRIMLTTRLEQVGLHCPRSYLHRIHFLNEDESCSLFCEKVFGENSFPPELETVGKKICRNCRGLPLSIVVIAGLLSTATKTHHEWEKIAENISSVTSNDEQCSKILDLSYNNLPQHLKGCYLYMGIFPEDFNIPVKELLKLWIAEGFVKSTGPKTFEDAAEEYLLDLVQRSLVMVSEESSRGKIKACKLHDLLRHLCTNEPRRGNFFLVSTHETPLSIRSLRRTIIRQGKRIERGHRVSIHPDKNFLPGVKSPSTPLPRSIIYFDRHLVTKFVYFRLLKVLYIHYSMIDLPKEIMELVNLRCIDAKFREGWYLASIDKLRNLQTITLHSYGKSFELPQQIWKMQQLRHVQFSWSITLPCPPKARVKGEIPVIFLENLQTLSVLENFRCTEAVLKRIPNLKKLGVGYSSPPEAPLDWGYYRLHNLARLHKLELLKIEFSMPSPSFLQNITFLASLRKLSLMGCRLPWKDMTIVGSLSNLQVLKLRYKAFECPEWEPIEGEFDQLKYLLLAGLDLKHWRAENIHFPKLRQLVIRWCSSLEMIPFGIAEIPTLDSIELLHCSPTVVTSAKEIKEEQLNMGNDFFRLRVNDYYQLNTRKSRMILEAAVEANSGCIVS